MLLYRDNKVIICTQEDINIYFGKRLRYMAISYEVPIVMFIAISCESYAYLTHLSTHLYMQGIEELTRFCIESLGKCVDTPNKRRF